MKSLHRGSLVCYDEKNEISLRKDASDIESDWNTSAAPLSSTLLRKYLLRNRTVNLQANAPKLHQVNAPNKFSASEDLYPLTFTLQQQGGTLM